MRDCECKGRNPNCIKCEGKGYVPDNTSIFGSNIKSSSKALKGLVKKVKKNKKASLTSESGEKTLENIEAEERLGQLVKQLPRGYYFNEKGQVTKHGKPIFKKKVRRKGKKKKK